MKPEADREFMASALRLGARGLGRTSPNPAVGALVVAAGAVAGAGWHRRAGEDHAEVIALREAGEAARGATLYVTLEPCAHQGRTPPCTGAIVAAGVARVVIAVTDPDPRVGGKGIAELIGRGIAVDLGTGQAEAEALNEAYLLQRRLGRPFVTYKAAASLDGRTAAADGTSQWITGEAARRDAHRLRAASDGICVGIGTVLADNPSLTARGVRAFRTPLRVVLDSQARTPLSATVLDGAAPTLIAVSAAAPTEATSALERAGAEVLRVPAARPGQAGQAVGVDLPALLGCLAGRGVVSLLLEGGARLAGSFARAGLIDLYRLYLAPKLLGNDGCCRVCGPGEGPGSAGLGGGGLLDGWWAPSIADAHLLRLDSVRRIGGDLRIDARPLQAPAAVTASPEILPTRGSDQQSPAPTGGM